MSSPLFAIMKEDGFLAMVSYVMSLLQKSIGGFAFVDDMDLCMSGLSTTTLTAQQMQ